MTTILARYKGRVILKVPGDAKLNPVDFKLNVGPETNSKSFIIGYLQYCSRTLIQFCIFMYRLYK